MKYQFFRGLKKIRNSDKNIVIPMEKMNKVNLFAYFTSLPDIKLLIALPNAHMATANPTYFSPTQRATKSCKGSGTNNKNLQ